MSNSTANVSSQVSTSSINDFGWEITPLDMCAYITSVLFGFPAHSCILWLIVTGSGVASEFFIFNLSVCEIGICLNSFLSLISYCTALETLTRLSWILLGLMITGRPLFESLICVERYLAVVHPVIFLKYKPLRYRLICCIPAWIIIFASSLYCVYTINQSDAWYLYYFSIQYLLFISIQLFCLVSVLRALKQSGPGDTRRKEENHMKRRAFNLILMSTVTMTVMYMPYIVAGFICIFIRKFFLYLFSFGFFCFVLAGFVQPLLYLHRAGKLPCLCST